MIFCIFNPYGNLRGEGWTDYRTSLIADALKARKHNVYCMASRIEHRSQTLRNSKKIFEYNNNNYIKFKLQFLYWRYKNTGFSRVLFELIYSIEYVVRMFGLLKKSDCVLVVEPAPFASWIIHFIKFVFNLKYLIVYDVLDMFPNDYVYERKSRFSFVFNMLARFRDYRLSLSDLIFFVSEKYKVDLNIKKNIKQYTSYIGFNNNIVQDIENENDKNILNTIDDFLYMHSGQKIIYAGSFGDAYGFDDLILQLEVIFNNGSNLKLVFVGQGNNEMLLDCSRKYPDNLLITSSVSSDALPHLYRRFNVGLITYSKGSAVSMPLKFFDYVKHNLLILNNSKGEASNFIDLYGLGLNSLCDSWYDLPLLLKLLDSYEFPEDFCSSIFSSSNICSEMVLKLEECIIENTNSHNY